MKDLASLHALAEARREEMVEDMMAMSRIPSILSLIHISFCFPG